MRSLETALLLAGVLPAALAIGPLRPRVAARGGGSRWRRVTAVVGAIGLVAAAGVARWALPPVALPTPTGPFAVGTSTVQWTDQGRPEPATPDPADRRTVVAQLWYPAQPLPPDLPRARYLGRDAAEAEEVGRGLAAQFGLPEIVFNEAEVARTAAVTDAPADRAHGPYPVVLFSPGLAGVRAQNTAWAQELASHGFVVMALDHPYDSAAVVLADGRVVRSTVVASGDDAEDNRRAAAWTAIRAADLRSALDRLAVLDRAPGPLAGLVDLRFVAVAGHSLGGAAAAAAAQQDHRFAAVVDVDGFPRALAPYPQPALALVAGNGTGDAAADRAYANAVAELLANSGAGGYGVTVPGAPHLAFTDASLYLPPLPDVVGGLGRHGGPQVTAAATLEFLEAVRAGRAPRLEAFGRVTARP